VEVSRSNTMQVTDIVETSAFGGWGIVYRREGLLPMVLVNAGGSKMGGERNLLIVGRGAAHSNTQEERDESRDRLRCQEEYRRVEGRR